MTGDERTEQFLTTAARRLFALRGIAVILDAILVATAWLSGNEAAGILAIAILVAAGGALVALSFYTHRRKGSGYAAAVTLLFALTCFDLSLLSTSFLALILIAYDLITAAVAGSRDYDRVRGSGRATCPHCSEYAVQDVVDRMRFLRIFGYRLAVIGRRRDLICRRCQFRRKASADDVHQLHTAGQRVRGAVLAPMGFLGLLAAVLIVYFGLFSQSEIGGLGGLGYHLFPGSPSEAKDLNKELGPYQLELPNGWTLSTASATESGQHYLVDSAEGLAGASTIKVVRDPANTTLSALILAHLNDDYNINSAGYPTTPPAATCTKVGGEKAAKISFHFKGYPGETDSYYYFVVHDGVGYAIEFSATSALATQKSQALIDLPDIEKHVIASFIFTGKETAPSFTPSPSPSPSPSAAPAASGSPTPAPAANC